MKGSLMAETIREYVDSGDQRLRVDRTAGVLHGVKLLGTTSKNGRQYRESALREAARLYEGAKVNVNHPKGSPLAPRDYQDRLGVIHGVEFRPGEGLFANLHFNPKHALSEQLVWDAEHQPSSVGLSHNVLARTSRNADGTTVEAITRVQSVDLVADPATTQGLFEQTDDEPDTDPQPPHDRQPIDLQWDALTVEHLRLHRPDLVRELTHDLQEQLDRQRQRLDELSTERAVAERRQRALELLSEYELPAPAAQEDPAGQIVSEAFVDSLIAAPDEEAMRLLVEARANLVRSAQRLAGERVQENARPRSRDQLSLVPQAVPLAVESAADFARLVRV